MLFYVGSILIACLIAGLSVAVEHFFPWRMLMGKMPHPLVCYVLGLLAILLPYSVLLLVWSTGANAPLYLAALALWCIVVVSGLSTLACYALEWVLLLVRQVKEHQEREDHSRETINRMMGDKCLS